MYAGVVRIVGVFALTLGVLLFSVRLLRASIAPDGPAAHDPSAPGAQAP
jgi:hypothetical protein